MNCPICHKEAAFQEYVPGLNKDDPGYYHYVCADKLEVTHFSCYTNTQNQLTQFYLYAKNLRIRCLNQIPPIMGSPITNFNTGWDTGVMKTEKDNWEPIIQGPETLSPQEAYQKLLSCHNLLVFL
jgi:hypothetical protein